MLQTCTNTDTVLIMNIHAVSKNYALLKWFIEMSRSHFFAPESKSFDFEYLLIPSPSAILWQCINAVPSNLHILLQALDFHFQIIRISSRCE